MRSHAKASSAGSNQRQASGLGRFFRRAFATRGASIGAAGSGAPRVKRFAIPVAVLAAAALALSALPASATQTHLLKEVFGSAAQPEFSADRELANDHGTGQLYVLDSTDDGIYRFNANGTPSNFSALGSHVIDGAGVGDETPQGSLTINTNRQREQVAIDESGGATDGNIYVTQSLTSAGDVVDIFSSSGEYLGQLTGSATEAFGEPCGVAVDSAGRVYVSDRVDNEIHVYEPAANPPVNGDNVTSLTTVTNPCTLAVGAGPTAGFLFVDTSSFTSQLLKIDGTTGSVEYTIASGGSTVSVDPATGHVYVARNTGSSSTVDKYDASGAAEATLISSFAPGSTAEGLAVSEGGEEIYVSRSGTANIEVYGPTVTVPTVTTEAASPNTGVHATLNGSVDPDGVELDECFFEWGPTTAYGNTVPCDKSPAEIGAAPGAVSVSAEIGGLQPNGAQYEFRLVAVNTNGRGEGSNQSFVTPDTVITEAATGVTASAATLNGSVNPDGEPLLDCFFEWGPSAEYGETAPCVPNAAGIGAGTAPVPVEADISGLEVGAVYHFRLKAENANGPIVAEDETLQTLGPVIAATWSENVTSTEAVLKAEINPEGKATTYRFEYGTTEAYGSETAELAVGSDSSNHVVSRFIGGLQPGTTYHYRVVATDEDEVANEGPDQTFTTYAQFVPRTDCSNQDLRFGPSANLPDCRAYEMVSPIDKNGGDIETAEGDAGLGSHVATSYRRASIKGGKVTFSAATAFGDAAGGHFSNQYLSTRGAGGWTTHGISSRRWQTVTEPEFAFNYSAPWHTYGFFQGFSPDLSSAWMRDDNVEPLAPGALEGYVNLYRRDNEADAYEPLITAEPLAPAFTNLSTSGGFGRNGGPRVFGASDDLRHQVFAVNAALTPDAHIAGGNQNVQLYDLVDGELHLVSVLPNGNASSGNSVAGTASSSGLSYETLEQMHKNAVSADGSRIVWTDSGSSSSGPGALYVRENSGQPQSASGECDEEGKACTVHVAGATTFGAVKAQFWAASASGSQVLYSTGNDPEQTLFLFGVDAESHTEVAGKVRAVVAAADDLSHVYYVSTADLDGGGPAEEGAPNLYVYSGGESRLLTALSEDDVQILSKSIGGSQAFSGSTLGLRGSPQPIVNQTRVTPDGRHFAFMSNSAALSESVAGYDNTDVATGKPDFEVYRYDADSEELDCVSCVPSGARPRGHLVRGVYAPTRFEFTEDPDLRVAGSIPTWERDDYASRVVSDDGSRVFFHSDDALLPRDTNGVQDLYQWQAQGTGGCTAGANGYSAQNDGCISLISTGRGGASEFVDATPGGDEVYFATSESIDPRDPGLRDIYVAKQGGGFPLPAPSAACEGETCQSPPAPPQAPQPSSETFAGPGDPVQAGPSCQAFGRRAKRFANRAKRQRRAIRRQARRSNAGTAKTRRIRRSARRNARKAKALSKRAKRCRRANRQASTIRRAGR